MISDYLVDKMLDYHVIAEDDRIIYLYGIKEGLTILQNIIISIVLGILFNNLFQTFIFLIAYIPLRSFAGGYHAASVKKCMVYSLILIILLEYYFVFSYLLEYRYLFPALLIAMGVIFKYAPLQSENKPLSFKENRCYARKTKRILVIEGGIVVGANILKLPSVVHGISIALIVEGVLLMVGLKKAKG